MEYKNKRRDLYISKLSMFILPRSTFQLASILNFLCFVHPDKANNILLFYAQLVAGKRTITNTTLIENSFSVNYITS